MLCLIPSGILYLNICYDISILGIDYILAILSYLIISLLYINVSSKEVDSKLSYFTPFQLLPFFILLFVKLICSIYFQLFIWVAIRSDIKGGLNFVLGSIPKLFMKFIVSIIVFAIPLVFSFLYIYIVNTKRINHSDVL